MLTLLLFILFCYGASNIVVFGSIFKGLRVLALKYSPSFFGKLLTCMMCLPFWWGAFFSIIAMPISGTILQLSDVDLYYFSIPSKYLGIFLDACIASGTTWFIHTVQEAFERSNTK